MPLYEYTCDVCKHQLEVEQKVADAPLQECPRCKVCALKRLISGCSFMLKGGGWAADLYVTPKKAGSE